MVMVSYQRKYLGLLFRLHIFYEQGIIQGFHLILLKVILIQKITGGVLILISDIYV